MKVFFPVIVNYFESMDSAEASRLISKCVEGDEKAIEVLVRQYEAGVYRLAYSILGDAAEASEITQETFIRALKSLATYREQYSFKAWLYKITLNLSRSHLRKQKVIERLRNTLTIFAHTETQKQISIEESVVQNEKETVIWHALNELDEKHRVVMVLRYFHEISTKEIAEALSISEGTVHSRLFTARERMRSVLEDLERD